MAAESPWSQSNWLQNQRFDPVEVQYMNDLMQSLMCGLEWYRALLTMPFTKGAGVSNSLCLHSSHKRTFWITTVTQISQNVWNNFKFIVKPIFFSEYRPFLDICVLQRSVAMHLRCDVNDHFITRLLLSPLVKDFFENRSIFGKVMSKSRVHVFDSRGI